MVEWIPWGLHSPHIHIIELKYKTSDSLSFCLELETQLFLYHGNLGHIIAPQFLDVPIVRVHIIVVQTNLNTECSVKTLNAIWFPYRCNLSTPPSYENWLIKECDLICTIHSLNRLQILTDTLSSFVIQMWRMHVLFQSGKTTQTC